MQKSGKVRHIVMFQFNEGSTTSELDEIAERFSELQNSISGITSFEWGLNNSPENLSEGLTHCFVLTFASIAARDNYLPHPNHVAFASWAKKWIAKVVVFDYCE